MLFHKPIMELKPRRKTTLGIPVGFILVFLTILLALITTGAFLMK